ncbi:MAG: hypothetical protein SPK70_05270 [Succinivibrio dextrinosolvens]|nr:hypothetical protein [Succinivibrio dextrinosolvens]MDY6470460.1 hypothetical protein [Succinivibrio dextrinosolvens]
MDLDTDFLNSPPTTQRLRCGEKSTYGLLEPIYREECVLCKDKLLLSDLEKIINVLKPKVVSIYDIRQLKDEDLSFDSWMLYLSYFFNSSVIKYLRIKTVYGVFTLGKTMRSNMSWEQKEDFTYHVYDFSGYDLVKLKSFLKTLNYKTVFHKTIPETRCHDTVYIGLNDWTDGVTFPFTLQLIYWFDEEYFSDNFDDVTTILDIDEWVKKNGIVVCRSYYGMSLSYAITAPLSWAREVCPELISSVYEIRSQDGNPPDVDEPFATFLPYSKGPGVYDAPSPYAWELRYEKKLNAERQKRNTANNE